MDPAHPQAAFPEGHPPNNEKDERAHNGQHINGAEGQPRQDPPFNNWEQTDLEGHIIWKRKLPHPGDGPRNQKKGSDGNLKDVRWDEAQETTKRIYGREPFAIVYDINRIFNDQVK